MAALAAFSSGPAGPSVGLASGADALRESQDRAAIEALESRYVHAIDTLDAEAYVQTFAPDGQLGIGERVAKGTAALRRIVEYMAKDAQERNAGRTLIELYHVMTNVTSNFPGKDQARVHYYWMALYTTPRPPERQGVMSGRRTKRAISQELLTPAGASTGSYG